MNRKYAVEVSRSSGYSPMGHFFPADTRLMKHMGEVIVYGSIEEAEAVAEHYRKTPSGYTAKTYRVVEYTPNSTQS